MIVCRALMFFGRYLSGYVRVVKRCFRLALVNFLQVCEPCRASKISVAERRLIRTRTVPATSRKLKLVKIIVSRRTVAVLTFQELQKPTNLEILFFRSNIHSLA